jgi:hypothetical protein
MFNKSKVILAETPPPFESGRESRHSENKAAYLAESYDISRVSDATQTLDSPSSSPRRNEKNSKQQSPRSLEPFVIQPEGKHNAEANRNRQVIQEQESFVYNPEGRNSMRDSRNLPI